jgi:hypothetical protein
MQLHHVQDLVSKLKENKDMQVETTTLGKFLGAKGDRLAMVLGREILNRPILVSTSVNCIQILDLDSGFVVVLKSLDELLPTLLSTFSREEVRQPERVSSAERNGEEYGRILKKDIQDNAFSQQLFEIHTTMQKSGNLGDRIKLIERTIQVLETMKNSPDGELQQVEKTKIKLGNMIRHINSKKLAPGQIPSVFEIAIWRWIS